MPKPEVIEQLYAAFADCGLPEAMEYCTYCDTEEYEPALHGDLSTLPAELVDKYTWDAMHHTGDEKDFKHFVPRIYELLSEGGLPFADPEMVLGRLAMASWSEWPASQQRALTALLDVMWDKAIISQTPPVCIEDLVCGLCLAWRGVAPWLIRWTSDRRPQAIERLAEFIVIHESALVQGRLRDAWWGQHEMRQVVNWVLSEDLLNGLGNADDSALTTSALALLTRLWAARGA